MATNPYGPQTGLLGLLGAGSNPIYRGLKDGGLLDSLAYGLASGTGFGDGLQKAALAQIGGKNDRQERAVKAAEWDQEAAGKDAFKSWLTKTRPDLAPLMDAGVDQNTLFTQALKPQGSGVDPIEINGQLVDPNTFEVLGDFRTVEGKGGNAEVALQPTWMQDGQGNWVLGQLSKDGSIVQTKLPDGMRAANPGAVAGDRTSGTVDAKTAGAARATLPSAEQNYEIAVKAADALLNDKAGMAEQFGNIMGVPQQMTPAWPGSPKANFQVQLDQLTGQAFLNIRQALKGAGAVTDYEGQRGEVALSRAQAAAEKGDQKAFEAAVIEFKDAITKGLDLMRETAQGGYSAGSPAVGGAPTSGNMTSTGVPWSIE